MSDRVFEAAAELLAALSPSLTERDRQVLGAGVDAGEPTDAIEGLLWAAASRGLPVPASVVDAIHAEVADGEFETPSDLRVTEYLATITQASAAA